MLVHNLTPFPFGYVVCSRRPPQPEMSFIVRAKFRFAPGQPLSPVGNERYIPEYMTDDARRMAGEAFDRLAQGALTGDVFAEGDDAMTGELQYPSDFADFKPHADVMMRASCYPPPQQSKQCLVRIRVGQWEKELRVVGPRAWVDQIAGGKKTEPMAFTKMPIDYAHAYGGPDHPLNPVGMGHSGDNVQRVPCIESIKDRGELAEPAGFAPVSPFWQQRSAKRGTKYDDDYRETRAPYYAEDFDWTYFNAAPTSQQLPQYLRGDEEVVCDHMHPEAERVKGRLPGLRIRVFVRDVEGSTRPLIMVLDTLFVDMQEEVLYLTWRGLTPIKEADLSDVDHVLVAAEEMKDAPKSDAEYIEQLAEIAADPHGAKKIFGDDPEAQHDLIDEAPDHAETLANAKPEEVKAFIADKLGPFGAMGDGVLGTAVGKLMQLMPADKVQDLLGKRQQGPSAVFEQLEVSLKNAKKKIEDEGGDASGLDAAQARLDEAKKHMADAGAERGQDEPGPNADCRGQDLSGADLRERDLRGANFANANLSKAKLTGAKLAGADLTRAVMFRADLSDADLTGAKLEATDLTLAVAIKARFDRTTCDHAVFRRTVLDGASFKEMQASHARFSKAEMAGTDLSKAALHHVWFDRCKLDDASLAEADLGKCHLQRCTATSLSLQGAKIDGASVDNSELQRCNFSRIQGEYSVWRGSTLDGCDLSFSHLPAAQFERVSAAGASFDAAMLRGARFYRANLRRADLSRADLLGVDFRLASIDKARFNNANLYMAQFVEAAGVDADFAGATLDRANFDRCKVVRK